MRSDSAHGEAEGRFRFVVAGVDDLDTRHLGEPGAFAADADHGFDGFGIPHEQRFDRAVAAVAHPAAHAAVLGGALDGDSESDALHAAVHDHPLSHARRLERMPALKLDHVVIAVSDWERSIAFYRDVLGAEIRELAYGRCAFRFGDQQLNVHGPGATPEPRAATPVAPGNSDLCFAYDGTPEDALAHLREHMVEPILGPVERQGGRGRGTSVYFRDPDGSLLEFICY